MQWGVYCTFPPSSLPSLLIFFLPGEDKGPGKDEGGEFMVLHHYCTALFLLDNITPTTAKPLSFSQESSHDHQPSHMLSS